MTKRENRFIEKITVENKTEKMNTRLNDLMRDSIINEQTAFKVIDFTSDKMRKYSAHCTQIEHKASKKKFYCFTHFNDIQLNTSVKFFDNLDERDRTLIESICKKSMNANEYEFTCFCNSQSIDSMFNQFIDLLLAFDYVLNNHLINSELIEKKSTKASKSKQASKSKAKAKK